MEKEPKYVPSSEEVKKAEDGMLLEKKEKGEEQEMHEKMSETKAEKKMKVEWSKYWDGSNPSEVYVLRVSVKSGVIARLFSHESDKPDQTIVTVIPEGEATYQDARKHAINLALEKGWKIVHAIEVA